MIQAPYFKGLSSRINEQEFLRLARNPEEFQKLLPQKVSQEEKRFFETLIATAEYQGNLNIYLSFVSSNIFRGGPVYLTSAQKLYASFLLLFAETKGQGGKFKTKLQEEFSNFQASSKLKGIYPVGPDETVSAFSNSIFSEEKKGRNISQNLLSDFHEDQMFLEDSYNFLRDYALRSGAFLETALEATTIPNIANVRVENQEFNLSETKKSAKLPFPEAQKEKVRGTEEKKKNETVENFTPEQYRKFETGVQNLLDGVKPPLEQKLSQQRNRSGGTREKASKKAFWWAFGTSSGVIGGAAWASAASAVFF